MLGMVLSFYYFSLTYSGLVLVFNFFFKLTFSRARARPRPGGGGGARARQENRQFHKKIEGLHGMGPPSPPLALRSALGGVRARLEIVNL
jgi:hypothetical protein